MHKCHNFDMTHIDVHHSKLEFGNIHFMSGKLIDNFRDDIHKQLPAWLRDNNSTIAIWIQTGSWDFAYIGFDYAMGHFIKVFEQILSYIQQEIDRVPYHVDLRVIGTTPMPDKWYNNNFVIGAFNARMRAIVERMQIDFTDAFQFELPCHNQVARLGSENRNHYFHREKINFAAMWEVTFTSVITSQRSVQDSH